MYNLVNQGRDHNLGNPDKEHNQSKIKFTKIMMDLVRMVKLKLISRDFQKATT